MARHFSRAKYVVGMNEARRMKWIIGLIALIAAGMSLWLTVEKLTGRIDSLAGCGAGSGCSNVLGSKWSVVFGIVPVSVFSCVLYLGVMVSFWMKGEIFPQFRKFAAWLLIWAAVWFILLQVVVMKTICPYCMTMHGLGVALALCVLVFDREQRGVKTTRFCGVALLMVAGLAGIQYWGPDPQTYRLDEVSAVEVSAREKTPDVHAQGKGRVIEFLEGRKLYRLESLPHIGDEKAKNVIVMYFDYSCEACFEEFQDLQRIVKKYPSQLAVIVLPVPMHRTCNPFLPKGMKSKSNACEMARLSLKLWVADREKFSDFHTWLFEFSSQPLEVAEAMASSLVGDVEMSARDQSWIDDVLAQNVKDYGVFIKETPVMPKILLKGSTMIQGKVKGRDLEQLLKTQLQFD